MVRWGMIFLKDTGIKETFSGRENYEKYWDASVNA